MYEEHRPPVTNRTGQHARISSHKRGYFCVLSAAMARYRGGSSECIILHLHQRQHHIIVKTLYVLPLKTFYYVLGISCLPSILPNIVSWKNIRKTSGRGKKGLSCGGKRKRNQRQMVEGNPLVGTMRGEGNREEKYHSTKISLYDKQYNFGSTTTHPGGGRVFGFYDRKVHTALMLSSSFWFYV